MPMPVRPQVESNEKQPGLYKFSIHATASVTDIHYNVITRHRKTSMRPSVASHPGRSVSHAQYRRQPVRLGERTSRLRW